MSLSADNTIGSNTGRVSLMLDFYNPFNSNAVTNFSLRTGDNERFIATLDPVAMKVRCGTCSERERI